MIAKAKKKGNTIVLAIDYDEQRDELLGDAAALLFDAEMPLFRMAWYMNRLFGASLERIANCEVEVADRVVECRLFSHVDEITKRHYLLYDYDREAAAGLEGCDYWSKMLLVFGAEPMERIHQIYDRLYTPYPTANTLAGSDMEQLRRDFFADGVNQIWKVDFTNPHRVRTDMFDMTGPHNKLTARQKDFLSVQKQLAGNLLLETEGML